MRFARVIAVSGVLSAASFWGGIPGAITSLGAGALALAFLPQQRAPSAADVVPTFRAFGPWLIASLAFAGFVVVLFLVFEESFLWAYPIAYVFLSPLFGAMACAIEAALSATAGRRSSRR